MAVLMAAIQGGAIRSLARRFGERALLVWGLVLLASAFPVVPLVGGVALLMLPLMVSAVGRAISQPPMVSIVSMRTAQENRGTLMGAFQSSAALARIVGPLLAGALYMSSMAAPFYLASGLFVLAAVVASGLRGVDAARPGASP